MLFGGFKTIYFDNLEILWEYRLNDPTLNSTITRNDIGLLVYGSEQRRSRGGKPEFPLLRNAIEDSFRVERIKSCWNDKLGVFPKYSRVALTSKKVRHEVILDDNGECDTNADPEAAYLKEYLNTNQTCCEILDAHGYNGSLFVVSLPEFSASKRKERITVPRSRERQDALESIKAGTGKHFQRTGGSAINDDDIFVAHERRALRTKMEEMEETKSQRELDVARQEAAFAVIALEKLPSKLKNPELKDLIDWKLGRPCPSKIKNKPERLALWLEELKDRPVKPALPWSAVEEEELLALQLKIEGDIALEDTEFGRKLEEERLKAKSIILAMPTPERNALLGTGGGEDDTSRTDDSTEHAAGFVVEAV